ncbi:MAG TPA: polyprenyl diphosphate synthase [Woeseiaceae bacterium]|nr:polyprenyl diphosphate synthase [Woeseiaceae bacterium]
MARHSGNPDLGRRDPRIPKHVAVIMDGNGRWAKLRSQPRHAGHRAGAKAVRQTVELAARRDVSFLTLFAFSSENWRRPPEEVGGLMSLFLEALQREIDDLHRNNVRLRFIGARHELAAKLMRKIEAAERRTRANDGLNLTVAVAYGGRWDIVTAARRVASRVEDGSLRGDDIDESHFASELALTPAPDPDLLIRTGGEQRISNFLLWNLAYAELYFCDCLWPDFGEKQFDDALRTYARRQRRYGYTGEQVGVA